MKRLAFAVLAVLLATTEAWAGLTPEPGLGLPRDVSLEGWRIDWLLQVTNFFIIVLFVVMCGWLVVAAVRHNKHHKPEYDHGTSRHHTIAAVTLSSIIFLVVDGNLFYNAMVDLNEAFWNWDRLKAENVVRVEVNARQWAWQIRYEGPDKEFGTEDDIVTLNDLRVPIDTPVAVQLRAVDVIHSFYLPNLRVKTDAVPGTTNHLWFQVDSTKLADAGGNEFDIACAQHCGTHHYKMKGVLKAVSKADFEAWQQEASLNSQLDYQPAPTVAERQKLPEYDAKFDPHWGWKWEKI